MQILKPKRRMDGALGNVFRRIKDRTCKASDVYASHTDGKLRASWGFLRTLFSETKTAALLELLRIPSESGQEKRKAEHILSLLKDMRVESWEDRHGNVLALVRGKSSRTILCEAHMDVVPRASGQVEGVNRGRLYGRGSSDTQSAIVTFLHVLDYVSARKEKIEDNLLVVFDVKEEISDTDPKGFVNFARDFQAGGYPLLEGMKISAAIIGEPTADDEGGLCVVVSSGGRLGFELSVGESTGTERVCRVVLRGGTGHSANPRTGVNVIAGLRVLAKELEGNGMKITGAKAGVLSGNELDMSQHNVIPDCGFIDVLSPLEDVSAAVSGWKMPEGMALAGVEMVNAPVNENTGLLLESAGKLVELDSMLEARDVCGVEAKPSCCPVLLDSGKGTCFVDYRIAGSMNPGEARANILGAVGEEVDVITKKTSRSCFLEKKDDCFLRAFGKKVRKIHVPWSHMGTHAQHDLGIRKVVVVSGGSREDIHTSDESIRIRTFLRYARSIRRGVYRLLKKPGEYGIGAQ
ncbi:MAG: M20/M25/M40 family metallo-hydrolase [Candidatus Micrarchaeota archaeon]